MPDREFYPTDEELDIIANWTPISVDSFGELFEYIRGLWHWPEHAIKYDECHYSLRTGGWSGNEDIIHAMKRNRIVWKLTCEWQNYDANYYFNLKRMGGGCRNDGNKFWKFELMKG